MSFNTSWHAYHMHKRNISAISLLFPITRPMFAVMKRTCSIVFRLAYLTAVAFAAVPLRIRPHSGEDVAGRLRATY